MTGMKRGFYRYYFCFTSFWGKACCGLAECVCV